MPHDTWPDGRPKSTLNRAAWEGTAPLVEPMPAPLEVGALCWERIPDDANWERRGGCIVARNVDHETGEVASVTVVNGTQRHGKFEMRRHELPADTIDRALTEAPTRERLYRTAGGCCRHIGDWGLTRAGGFGTWLLHIAVELVRIAAELDAANTAARNEHREAS